MPRTSATHESPTVDDHSGRGRAVASLVLTAVLWSVGGLFIKEVDWPPMAIAGARSGIASIVMLLFLGRPRFTWSTAQIGGAIAYAATVILFVTATKLTTSANAILLQYTAPVHIALFSYWFLGERVTLRDWITIGVVLAGMSLFFLDELSTGGFWGNMCAIGTGVSFAWVALCLRKQRRGSPLESLLLGNWIAALAGLPFMLQTNPGGKGFGLILVLGVFQLGLSYVLYARAIRHVTALEAALVSVVEPILNPIWVLLVLGEKPGPMALVGGAVVLVAVTARGVAGAARSSPVERLET